MPDQAHRFARIAAGANKVFEPVPSLGILLQRERPTGEPLIRLEEAGDKGLPLASSPFPRLPQRLCSPTTLDTMLFGVACPNQNPHASASGRPARAQGDDW